MAHRDLRELAVLVCRHFKQRDGIAVRVDRPDECVVVSQCQRRRMALRETRRSATAGTPAIVVAATVAATATTTDQHPCGREAKC